MADLTTTARVKAVLRLTTSEHDTHIGNIVSAVSKWVENRTGRNFLDHYSSDVVEYPKPYGQYIQLQCYPIVSITEIIDYDTTLDYTDDSDGDYRWERSANEGIVERSGAQLHPFDRDGDVSAGWSNAFRRIKVTYKGGYADVDSLPDDLRFAIDMLCAEVFRMEDRLGNVTSESVGSYSISYGNVDKAADTSGVLETIDSYAIPRLV